MVTKIIKSFFSHRYYGLGLWFPELFNRFENFYKNYPNVSVSVCEVMTPLNVALPDNSTSSTTFHCDGTSIDQRVFINTLTIHGVGLLGNVASGYLANRVGRRTIPGEIPIIINCVTNFQLSTRISRFDVFTVCG